MKWFKNWLEKNDLKDDIESLRRAKESAIRELEDREGEVLRMETKLDDLRSQRLLLERELEGKQDMIAKIKSQEALAEALVAIKVGHDKIFDILKKAGVKRLAPGEHLGNDGMNVEFGLAKSGRLIEVAVDDYGNFIHCKEVAEVAIGTIVPMTTAEEWTDSCTEAKVAKLFDDLGKGTPVPSVTSMETILILERALLALVSILYKRLNMEGPVDDKLAFQDFTDDLIQQVKRRRESGFYSYGVTVDKNPLSNIEWLRHAIEDVSDGLIYAHKVKDTEGEYVGVQNGVLDL